MASDDIPNASGIYKITCTANKRFYIGSAANLHVRRNTHFGCLRQNKHYNPHLQNAWNKYGEQSFTFEVLEYVLPMSLLAREQYWLNKLKPFGRKGFNILPEAGSNLGYKPPPEIGEKVRQSKLGKKLSLGHIEKLRQAKNGYKPPPEHMEKLRQTNLGKKHTPERIEKRRQTNLGKKRSPEAIERMKQGQRGRREYSPPEHMKKMRQAKLSLHEKKGN